MPKAIMGGYQSRHPSPYLMSRPDGLSNYVLLIIRSGGEFQLDGYAYTVRPGSALIVAPGTAYYYGKPDGDYVDDWLHFTVSESSLAQRIRRMANTPFSVGNMELYTFCIRQILWELSYGHPDYAQENMDSLFGLLFNHLFAAWQAGDATEEESAYYDGLQMVRLDVRNHFSQPHSIEELSGRLGISASYFRYLYKKHFGVSFHHDLIQMRIEQAEYTLLTSSLTIEQVAEFCGYSSEVHFYRQFKKVTGITPARFRREAGYLKEK